MVRRFLTAAVVVSGFASGFALIPAAAQDLSGELKDVNRVGFQQFEDVSRVFVRTTEPVSYKVDTSRPDAVVLVLENARIPLQNDRRSLDTRYFDSPVGYIRSKIIEGPSQSVQIWITLRDRVPFKEIQDDNFLALDFRR